MLCMWHVRDSTDHNTDDSLLPDSTDSLLPDPWCPRGPGDRGGHGPSRVCGGSPCTVRDPRIVSPQTPLPAGRGPSSRTPKAGKSDPVRF